MTDLQARHHAQKRIEVVQRATTEQPNTFI